MSQSLGSSSFSAASLGGTPSGTSAAAPRGGFAHLLDYVVPAVILLAVLVVLAPVPAPVVDLLLAANLTISVLALLGALAARTPLEMGIFPTFLLGSTLVRLVLNIATTRLILTRAAVDGAGAAGEVVQAFGEFVAANDLVVGGVIFAIIAIIQFVVITAGSTRTSEVAARFALDGLPGRQMAIDSDLQAGAITREQARLLRIDLQRHADFFASMDGASRFVRGEAVAGVIITLVNLVGGLAIGVLEHSLPLPRALEVYSRLTIGDGLVSAVPALLVSVATGLLISRSSQTVDLSRELGRQFAARPHVLVIAAVFLGLLSLTDLPFLPLATMAAATACAAFVVARRGRRDVAALAAGGGPPATARGAGERATSGLGDMVLGETALGGDRIAVDLGRGLAPLVAGAAPLVTLTSRMRTAIAGDIGIVVPGVTFRDDPTLPDRGYRVTVSGEFVCEEELPSGRLLAIPRAGEPLGIDGPEGIDPLGGRRAVWIAHARAETARRRGATVLDAADCVARSLEAAVRRRADELLSRDAVARLVESLRASQPALVEQVVPGVLTIAKVQRTLQCLLREGVPVRPLSEVLEVMADHAAEAQEPWQLAELVRRSMARTICRRARDPQGRLAVVRLAPAAIEEITESTGPGGPAAPSPRLVAELRRALRPGVDRGAAAVLLVPGPARRAVRNALARQIPELQVLAEEEVAGEGRVEVFATVGGEGVSRAA